MGSNPLAAGPVSFARAVFDAVRDENVSFMAGSLAYYGFVSLVPFVALSFFALVVVGGESLARTVARLTRSTLSPTISAFLRENVLNAAVSGTVGASVVGVVTLLWGALRLFRGLNTAFAEIYDTAADPSFVDGVADALVALVTIPVALVVVVVVTAAVSLVGLARVPGGTVVLLVCCLAVVFLPLYYVFPDADVSVREVLPGVVVAAFGWMLLQQLFQAYVVLTSRSAGSAIGAVILFLTWLYFAGVVLLVGCVVNAIHGGYYGTEPGG
jgi:membrane protein